MTWTIFLVLLSPNMVSHKIKAKKSTISKATDAGKETWLKPIRLLTPQHANSTHKTPIGTYNQAINVRRHASRPT